MNQKKKSISKTNKTKQKKTNRHFIRQGVAAPAFNPSTEEREADESLQFKLSLVLIVSSRRARTV